MPTTIKSATAIASLAAGDEFALNAVGDLDRKATAAQIKIFTETSKLDDFAAPDDNTDRDATASLHGLMPKADKSKLDGIESSADVTDITNVNAAAATVLGTVATGTWEATPIASLYLDADTAHLSGAQSFTGAKTFLADIAMTAANIKLQGNKLNLSAITFQEVSDVAIIQIKDDTLQAGMKIQNSDGFISLENGTSSVNKFLPVLNLKTGGDNALSGRVIGRVPVALDTGSTPIIRLEARQDDNTPVVNRPILAIYNHNTKLYEIDKDGNSDFKSKNLNNVVLVTPALGTPASGVLTNCTGLPTAGLVNDSVTNLKAANMAANSIKGNDTGGSADPKDLTAAEVLTLLNVAAGAEVNPSLISQAEAETGTATTERIFSALRVKQAIDALGGGGGGDFTDFMPTKLLPPNDGVAFPDVYAYTNGTTDGIVLPNSGASEMEFEMICPKELATLPALKVRIYMIPLATVANSTVNLTLGRLYVNDAENLDQPYTDETGQDVDLSTSTIEFLSIFEYDVIVEATAGELCKFRLKRNPASANDDFTDDLLVIAITGAWQRTPA